MEVNIATWNVNGLRSSIENKSLVQFLEKESPDILCIQETKANRQNDFEPLIEFLEKKNYALLVHCNEERRGYSGVAIMFKRNHPDLSFVRWRKNVTEGRLIECEFSKFIVINVYVPNSGVKLVRHEYRTRTWDTAFKKNVNKVLKLRRKPVVICGDMNVAHQEIDLARPNTNTKNAGFTPEERQNFGNLLKDCKLLDTWRHLHPTKTNEYTFWTARFGARGRNIGWRIDYILASGDLEKKITGSKIHTEQFGSDHAPITTVFRI